MAEKLGPPRLSLTDDKGIADWTRAIGLNIEPVLITGSDLYTFMNRVAPYKHILVFFDRDSQKVRHVTWCQM